MNPDMKTIKRCMGIVLIILCLKLAGCAQLTEDIVIQKVGSQGLIEIGMTLSQVAEVVGRGIQPHDYFYENTTKYGKFTIWKVRRSPLSDPSLFYKFSFRNGSLTDWSEIGGN